MNPAPENTDLVIEAIKKVTRYCVVMELVLTKLEARNEPEELGDVIAKAIATLLKGLEQDYPTLTKRDYGKILGTILFAPSLSIYQKQMKGNGGGGESTRIE